jgi:hypothetical protein
MEPTLNIAPQTPKPWPVHTLATTLQYPCLGFLDVYGNNAQHPSPHTKGLTSTYHCHFTSAALPGIPRHLWGPLSTLQPIHLSPNQCIPWPLHFSSPAWATSMIIETTVNIPVHIPKEWPIHTMATSIQQPLLDYLNIGWNYSQHCSSYRGDLTSAYLGHSISGDLFGLLRSVWRQLSTFQPI